MFNQAQHNIGRPTLEEYRNDLRHGNSTGNRDEGVAYMFRNGTYGTTVGRLAYFTYTTMERSGVYSSAVLVGMPINGRRNTPEPAYGRGVEIRGIELVVLYVVRTGNGDLTITLRHLLGTPWTIEVPARLHHGSIRQIIDLCNL